MDFEKSAGDTQRNFGFTEIYWEIDNYFSATCGKNWVIYSPEFSLTGYDLTEWRLFLKTSKSDEYGECFTLVYLECLKFDLLECPLKVHWELWYVCKDVKSVICRKQCVFEGKGSVPAKIKKFKQIEKVLQLTTSDKLSIGGLLLVHKTNKETIFNNSKELGLKSLSQDLRILYNLHYHSDFTVKVNGIPLRCHKSILCARNKVMEDLIESDPSKDEINLNVCKYNAAENVFAYLYSGNLNYVLRVPSISIYQVMDFLNITRLKNCYSKDTLHLHTRYNTSKFLFKWLVKDISSKNLNSLVSDRYGAEGLNMTFQLRLRMNETEKSIGVFVEVVQGTKPKKSCIIFDVIDVFGHSLNKMTKRWSSEEGGVFGFEDFLSLDNLKSPLFVSNDRLCIVFTLFIPKEDYCHLEVNRRSCSVDINNCEEHYSLLSTDIAFLLETGKYSDFTLICREEVFKVHKCILSARSPTFKRIVKNRDCYLMAEVDPKVLQITLGYIYSGKMENFEISDLSKLYDFAAKMVIVNLKNKCSEILRNNLQILNVLEALHLARTHKDFKLKVSAFKFITNNFLAIKRQDEWKYFINENAFLYEEIISYVKSHIHSIP